MEQLWFTLALALLSWLISWLTGRNRRQMKKIPEGMGILCQPPGKRYVLYALGVMVVGIVAFFGALYIMDGAPESARPMWALCVAVALLTFVVCIVGGNWMAQECVYFGSERIQVNRAFREPKSIRWEEIGRIEGRFEHRITLYLLDGTKFLTVGEELVNYEGFCRVLKIKCPRQTRAYYWEHPKGR